MTSKAIGCDIGTTSSVVAVYQNDRVEIISNDQGNRTTPSYVAFTDTERLVGDAAKNQVAMNPSNTVFDAKRLIGRKFDDPDVQNDIKHWPFKVVDRGNKPMIQVEYKGEEKVFAPEEISAMVVRKMKDVAEGYLGHEVTQMVVTGKLSCKFVSMKQIFNIFLVPSSRVFLRWSKTSDKRCLCYRWSRGSSSDQ